MRTLVKALTPGLFGAREVALPAVDVRARRPGTAIGPKLRALIDTGAAFTLAGVGVARLLGIGDDELTRGPSISITGVGGRPTDAYGVMLDLSIGATRDEALELPGAWVYFSPAAIPGGFQVLLGHHDVFERLTFSVLNHPPRRRFVLREPSTR